MNESMYATLIFSKLHLMDRKLSLVLGIQHLTLLC
jgi:hypothetical protein